MKPISFSEEVQRKVLADFQKFLATVRLGKNKINYSYTLEDTVDKTIKKPELYFTADAYLKMITLVDSTTDEIGWHGVVERDGHRFTVTDILVYPQVVTGSNIRTDQEAYNTWLMAQPDEIFNNIRYQGHSHVNFTVTPSDFGPGSDVHLYESILQTLRKTDYYIFMIVNKRREVFVMIYDMAQNVVFEKDDITIYVMLSNGQSLGNWHRTETEKHVVKQTYQYPTRTVNFVDSKKNKLVKSEAGKGTRNQIGFQTTQNKNNQKKSSKENKTTNDVEADLVRRYYEEFFEAYGYYPDTMHAATTLSVHRHSRSYGADTNDDQDYRRY
jgi:hypothetical protein